MPGDIETSRTIELLYYSTAGSFSYTRRRAQESRKNPYFKGRYDANFFFVNDPEIDAKISRSVLEFDVLKRIELYREIQRDVLKLKTVIPLVFGSEASGLWSPKVKNAPSHPMGIHTMPLETVEMQDE